MTFSYVVPHEIADKYPKDFSHHVVGTGAFRLAEWVPGQKIVLEPLDPWATVRLPGDAERLKSGAAAAGVKVAVDRYAPLPLVEPPGLPVAYPIR